MIPSAHVRARVPACDGTVPDPGLRHISIYLTLAVRGPIQIRQATSYPDRPPSESPIPAFAMQVSSQSLPRGRKRSFHSCQPDPMPLDTILPRKR